jgi:redox-sensitive bicupin YhaK (pirin superfamily)
MSDSRTIRSILYGQPFDMGGMPIRQPFPARGVEQIDPFLLLHHARLQVQPGGNAAEQGVGPHPHRGFSPVTFLFEGGIHHRDSVGNSQVVYAEGVQWMNAGSGLVHSERPPEAWDTAGGTQELIQLWINTPARHKMDPPTYYPLSSDNMPFILSEDAKTRIRLVCGELAAQKGPVQPLSPITACMVHMKAGASYFFPLPEHQEALIYLLDGELRAASSPDVALPAYHAVWFNKQGAGIDLTAVKNTRFLLVAGAPLQEPVAARGPFVMNTQEELYQAFADYQHGKMGQLEV